MIKIEKSEIENKQQEKKKTNQLILANNKCKYNTKTIEFLFICKFSLMNLVCIIQYMYVYCICSMYVCKRNSL